MQISGIKINNVSGVKKSAETKNSPNVSFQSTEKTDSSSAISVMGRAKILLDGVHKGPMSYEEKLKLLKQKGVKEEDFPSFLAQTDAVFKRMIECYGIGMPVEDISYILTNDDDLKKDVC